MIKLQKNQIYITAKNEIVYCLTVNSVIRLAYCMVISVNPNNPINFCRYYSIDGSYPSNNNYNIISKLSKFSKIYKQHKQQIEKMVDSLYIHGDDLCKDCLKTKKRSK